MSQLWNIAQELSQEYIRNKHPDQAQELVEYLHLLSLSSNSDKLPDDAYKFGPVEVLGQIVVPVVVGIVTNYLYDLVKSRLPFPPKNKQEQLEVLQVLSRERPKLEKRLIKQTKNEALVREVLDHVDNHMKKKYG